MARKMTLILILSLIPLGECNGRSHEESGFQPTQALQQVLDTSREAGEVIGVSAAIIDSQGKMWKGVSGNSYPGEPISEDMLFDMGSDCY